MKKIIIQGAEAIISKSGKVITKDRIKKSYRFQELDEKIRKRRTKKEFNILNKTLKIIPVPKTISSDLKKEIKMEYLSGEKLSESLDSLKNAEQICIKIGNNIAKLHDANVIHGDLTTSNMIYNKKKVYFIDFGLSYESLKIEDKATDLHLIKQALEAKHFKHFQKFFKAILKGYKISKNFKETMKRLEKVELRGRYKNSY